MSESRASAAQGRAITARPSLCLGLAAAAILLFGPAGARAQTPAPILTATDPGSPGLSLTPVVHGSSTGIIKSGVPGFGDYSIPTDTPAESTIVLYANKKCEGEPIAEGSGEDLDTTGIQITVEAETTTFITAEQESSEGFSGCSNTIEYQQVKELPKDEPPAGNPGGGSGSGGGASGGGNGGTTVPPAPPHLKTVPGGWANNLFPLVTGSAPGAASVEIYTGLGCTGKPTASGSAAQFAAGIPVRVAANAVVVLSGLSVGPGGARSRCSDPVYYGEDSTPPHTRITMGPASKTRKRVAVFRFTDTTGTIPGTDFFCRVNHGSWNACSSPLRLRHLRTHKYVFRVKAVDPAGNRDAKPAKRSFKVVRRP